jgi:hypothetical protein
VIGPYRIQAAIAAVHDEAPSSAATDWPRLVALYELLMRTNTSPMVALNHAVAVAMARGPDAGLELLGRLGDDRTLGADHRFHAVRAHLLEMSGDLDGARDAYEAAAQRATNLAQQRHLRSRAAGDREVAGFDPDQLGATTSRLTTSLMTGRITVVEDHDAAAGGKVRHTLFLRAHRPRRQLPILSDGTVGADVHARLADRGADEFESMRPPIVGEQPLPTAQDDRLDHEPVLLHKVLADQRASQAEAAHHLHVAAVLRAQPLD